jgi:D-xylose transport system substrate-binding protein
MKVGSRRAAVSVTAALVAVVLTVAGCSSDESNGNASDNDTGGAASGKIALLLPESKTTRYETQDRPMFEAKLKQLCSGCEVLYSNADQDPAKQQNQADQALTNGVKVLVLDPVDGDSASAIVNRAKARNVPVISYDRLVKNAPIDFYVSFDNELVGRLQGQALLDKLTADGTVDKGSIVMINGSPTDNNAIQFRRGAHSVLDGKVTIGREYDTPGWSDVNARDQMQQAITALGRANIVGVYAANDGTAGGAFAAMKGSGFASIPPLTGQDAEIAGIQRILAGEQYMTVYKAIKPEAEAAAQAAFDLLQGKRPTAAATTHNGQIDVPSTLLTPVAVTKSNVKDTVIKDGFWKVSDICTGEYVAACTAAGIS